MKSLYQMLFLSSWNKLNSTNRVVGVALNAFAIFVMLTIPVFAIVMALS